MSVNYAIRHVTRLRYTEPISEHYTEVRAQPRSDDFQICRRYGLSTRPAARTFSYRDHLQNDVSYFDISAPHRSLIVTAESLVQIEPRPPLPDCLGMQSWGEIDQWMATGDEWDMLHSSRFTQATPALDRLAVELVLDRTADPLSTLRQLNRGIYELFEYVPESTGVDSPIDKALEQRQGVCQDFAHIMTALVRTHLRIPCRYVSGYLYHGSSDRSTDDASHAWVEARLPERGWVGFDPTNNTIADDRHIAVAVGRDYADVPPTRGIFRGKAEGELSVSVHVYIPDETPPEDDFVVITPWSPAGEQAQLAREAAAQQ